MALLLLAAACGDSGGSIESSTGSKASPGRLRIPTQIVGLKVTPEKIPNGIEEIDRPYIDSIGLFSLREGDLLRATLQVTRFNRAARPKSDQFRKSIIGLLGSSKPDELKLGEETVFSTAGNQQNIFVWFEGKGAFVLSIHQDFEFPRTLLRRTLALNLQP